jgi:hypothetical protein
MAFDQAGHSLLSQLAGRYPRKHLRRKTYSLLFELEDIPLSLSHWFCDLQLVCKRKL